MLGSVIGLLAAGVAWTSDPIGAWRALCCLSAGAWLVMVVLLMRHSDPSSHAVGLPIPEGRDNLSGVLVLIAWLQPCLWPAVLAVGIRVDLAAALAVLGWGVEFVRNRGGGILVCPMGYPWPPDVWRGAAGASTWLGAVAMGGGVP